MSVEEKNCQKCHPTTNSAYITNLYEGTSGDNGIKIFRSKSNATISHKEYETQESVRLSTGEVISAIGYKNGHITEIKKEIILIHGYYKDGDFYPTAEYKAEEKIVPSKYTLYIDDNTDSMYFWTGTAYRMVSIGVADEAFYSVIKNEGETDAQAIARATEGHDIYSGDLCAVKTLIADDKYQYATYVYNDDLEGWQATTGSYSADTVIFDKDLIYTEAIGVLPKPSTYGTISAKGKSVKTVLQTILATEKQPTITQPSLSLSNTSSETIEYGTSTTKNMKFSFSRGSYQYGPSSTGVVPGVVSYTVTGATTTSGSGDDVVINASVGTSALTYTVTGTVSHSDGVKALTNLGNEADDYIHAGTKTVSKSFTISPKFYCVKVATTDELSTISLPDIRVDYSSGIFDETALPITGSLIIPAGTKSVIFALPGNKVASSIIDVNGMGLDVKDNFTRETVSVYNINKTATYDYTVYSYGDSQGLASTTYNFTFMGGGD